PSRRWIPDQLRGDPGDRLGIGDRHRRDQGNDRDRGAGGVEAVDQALGLLAGSGHEHAPPGEWSREVGHRSRAATISPSASGSSRLPDSSARWMAPSTTSAATSTSLPSSIRAHAPSGSRHPPPRLMSTARSAVTATLVAESPTSEHARAAPDPGTASSAIAPWAGEGTNSLGSRRWVN